MDAQRKLRSGTRIEVVWKDHWTGDPDVHERGKLVTYHTLGYVSEISDEVLTLAWHDGTINGHEDFMHIGWTDIQRILVLRERYRVTA